MTDYIDRQAAIDALNGEITVTGKANAEAVLGYAKLVVDRIKRLPSVDAESVKHGRWEWIGGYGYQYRCSECIMCAEYRTKYCPNCGAKMENEE